jgi:RNA polymerase sigma-70 factor (ECF subfamily)
MRERSGQSGVEIYKKSDPAFSVLRIFFMLTQSIHIQDPAQRPQPRAAQIPRKEHSTVPSAPDTQDTTSPENIAPETRWMLLVRDQRDKAAFAQLFDHFAPKLKGFVIRAGSANAQAEEIVQDVMLTVWHKAEQFDPHRAPVSAWIYQIARNRQIDMHRKLGRPLPEALKEDPELEPDASQILALQQETQQLKDALNRLAPAQRDMIEKAYLGELSHQDISSRTGLPLGTIKSRIRLGLERLRHDLKGMR